MSFCFFFGVILNIHVKKSIRYLFRPITEEEFFDAVEEELDKRDKLEEENNESSRLKNEPTTPNEHHIHTIGLDFKIRVSDFILRKRINS